MDTLLELAETLDNARLAANANDVTAPQSDAYGDISNALKKVIRHIVGSDEEAERVYFHLLDSGESIRSALVAGYNVNASPTIRNMWKVQDDRTGENVGRIYLNRNGDAFSPERAVDRVLASQYSLDAALFELVQDYRLNP